MRNVCLQTYRNNRMRQKVVYFFKKMHPSRVNNSRVLRIKNYYITVLFLYEHTNIQRCFQVCVSVLLRYSPEFGVLPSLI